MTEHGGAMLTHVKIIGILHIVLGGLGILAGVFVLLLFGGIAGLVGLNGDHDSLTAIPILGGIGGFVFIVLLVLSLPSVIAGIGLIRFRPWARVMTIVLSVLHLFNIPFGTALGVYGLWALLAPETEMLFRQQQTLSAYPRP
jgi:hypothetical protein